MKSVCMCGTSDVCSWLGYSWKNNIHV